jgi:trans-aconitate methyltransferase
VPWDRHQDVVTAQDRTNRPQFIHSLTQDWLPALGDIDARLRNEGGRIADVACGTGWSTIALARGYPKAIVDGLDPRHGLDRDRQRQARERRPRTSPTE